METQFIFDLGGGIEMYRTFDIFPTLFKSENKQGEHPSGEWRKILWECAGVNSY